MSTLATSASTTPSKRARSSPTSANQPCGKEIHVIADNSRRTRANLLKISSRPIGRFSCNSTDLFVLTQPGGAVGFPRSNVTSSPAAASLRCRLEAQTHALYPPLQSSSRNRNAARFDPAR